MSFVAALRALLVMLAGRTCALCALAAVAAKMMPALGPGAKQKLVLLPLWGIDGQDRERPHDCRH